MEGEINEKVLFADNVGFQLSQKFHEKCRDKINTLVYLLPANHTEKVQPIDATIGYLMKKAIGEAMERWLENEEYLDIWHDKLSCEERRILMTMWVGEAWEDLARNKDIFWKLFEKKQGLLLMVPEMTNFALTHNPNATAYAQRNGETVGHSSYYLSRLCFQLVEDGGDIEDEVIGKRFNAGKGMGLEVPIEIGFTGTLKYL
eukprot:gene13337-14716_t